MIKKVVLVSALSLVLGISHVNTAQAGNQVQCFRAFLDDTMALLEKGDIPMNKKRQMIIDRYLPIINFEFNAKMAMGLPYKALSPQDQKEYVNEYTKLLAYTWLPKLNYDRKNGIVVTVMDKTQPVNDKDEIVKARMQAPDGKSYDMDLRIRDLSKTDRKIKCQILNIVVEGVDLAATYRAQFSDQIEKNGGDGRVITKFLKEQNAKSKKETGLVVNIQ
jgi:ABC-type transporter MlaC component